MQRQARALTPGSDWSPPRWLLRYEFELAVKQRAFPTRLIAPLADARRKLAMWRYDYNNVRPHSSLGNRTPAKARRAFLLDGGVAPGALVPGAQQEYQTGRLSL
ncbi:MAG: integrase core domain-containing protein [Novosphingobium sp.]